MILFCISTFLNFLLPASKIWKLRGSDAANNTRLRTNKCKWGKCALEYCEKYPGQCWSCKYGVLEMKEEPFWVVRFLGKKFCQNLGGDSLPITGCLLAAPGHPAQPLPAQARPHPPFLPQPCFIFPLLFLVQWGSRQTRKKEKSTDCIFWCPTCGSRTKVKYKAEDIYEDNNMQHLKVFQSAISLNTRESGTGECFTAVRDSSQDLVSKQAIYITQTFWLLKHLDIFSFVTSFHTFILFRVI